MSCVTTWMRPMRAPAASSSAKLGMESEAFCARTGAAAAASAARAISRIFLINGRAGIAHHFAPLLILGAHEGVQFLRPHPSRLDAAGAEIVLHLRLLERLGDLARETLHDVGGHARRPGDVEP